MSTLPLYRLPTQAGRASARGMLADAHHVEVGVDFNRAIFEALRAQLEGRALQDGGVAQVGGAVVDPAGVVVLGVEQRSGDAVGTVDAYLSRMASTPGFV